MTNVSLKILNLLQSSGDYLSTSEIVSKIGCERKAVYKAIATLEINGFGIEVIKGYSKGIGNRYRFTKLYGIGAEK